MAIAIKGHLKRIVTLAMAAGAMLAGLVILTPGTSSAGEATSSSAPITWAEPPQSTPNYIFPYYPAQLCTVDNTSQFEELMYRPLYWFGVGSSPVINNPLSIGKTPTFSGNTVTVDLKNWKWSNGESVTGQDVLFYMNIYHAAPSGFCGYVKGLFPDNLTNVTATATTVTFTFNKSYNHFWILYNELGQITPLPIAWDIASAGAAPGSGGCSSAAYGTADAACTKVYTFLSDQAGYNPNNPSAANNSLSTYATNPIWQVVDGPWKLKSFNPDGETTMVPNPAYSGPVKATASSFTELPYTSGDAEFNALVGGDLSVGYIDETQISTGTSSPYKAGPNNPRLTGSFDMNPWISYSVNYFPINFSTNADGGLTAKLFAQAYIRQAMQSLINQPLYIKKIFKGYAVPTYGPVPVAPPNPYSSKLENTNPFPYSPSRAKALLVDNGWKVVPNGTDTCVKAGTAKGDCGAGIPTGTPLKFSEQYATGVATSVQEDTAMKASWSSEGINVALSGATFDTVTANAIACPNGCSWQIQEWNGGWTFAPDYYPSGEDLFELGSEANYGDYSDAQNQSLINQTIDTNQPLTNWENYLAKQVPDFFQPNEAYALTEYNKDLTGVAPQNAFLAITPEAWRWK